jgi:hypothetical protein
VAAKLDGLPVAVIWKVKGCPAWPMAAEALLITGVAGAALLTVRVSVAVPDPAEFVAVRPIVETPAAVGVPEMSPATGSSVRPLGSPEAS